MKTESNQTESGAPKLRASFYKPDRHYVTVQIPDNTWDGDQLDRLLDAIDPATGEAAYRIEADGSKPDGRRITGDRRKMLLSCSADYIRRVSTENSNSSQENARRTQQNAVNRSRVSEGRSIATVEDETFGGKEAQTGLPQEVVG